MDLNKENFKKFDIITDDCKLIPDVPGNYILVLRQGCVLPGNTQPERFSTVSFDGVSYQVIYTGISQKGLRGRDYKQHFTGNNAGRSTLRKSLGSLMGLTKVPRDKDRNNNKTKFSEEDETILSEWMKKNLLLFYRADSNPENEETRLIAELNPPLNLKGNNNPVNKAFRTVLSALRK